MSLIGRGLEAGEVGGRVKKFDWWKRPDGGHHGFLITHPIILDALGQIPSKKNWKQKGLRKNKQNRRVIASFETCFTRNATILHLQDLDALSVKDTTIHHEANT
ncbi:hypothetical protein OUZ56_009357 [Daphnia magna]|uniref:Uncharacterized protein n=1 Tax=Daphnia magna TaxID=35525 RepID=A0ABR0AG06_9CRUS|nr:hypothetical protein OUZ56_009357 [Daphnia magna]